MVEDRGLRDGGRVFLEVVTRCYRRPRMLAVNQAALRRQSCEDWVQTLLVDEVGWGVAWANESLKDFVPQGEWVWLLDDDDVCVYPNLVRDLREVAGLFSPDVVMVRMDHGEPLGILPDPGSWGKRPVHGRVGNAAFVLRREVWLGHAEAWRPLYDGDFYFIDAVFESTPRVYWHDVVASRVQRRSIGKPE